MRAYIRVFLAISTVFVIIAVGCVSLSGHCEASGAAASGISAELGAAGAEAMDRHYGGASDTGMTEKEKLWIFASSMVFAATVAAATVASYKKREK